MRHNLALASLIFISSAAKLPLAAQKIPNWSDITKDLIPDSISELRYGIQALKNSLYTNEPLNRLLPVAAITTTTNLIYVGKEQAKREALQSAIMLVLLARLWKTMPKRALSKINHNPYITDRERSIALGLSAALTLEIVHFCFVRMWKNLPKHTHTLPTRTAVFSLLIYALGYKMDLTNTLLPYIAAKG